MLRFFKTLAVVLAMSVGAAMADVQIQAGGATFPDPIYQQWIKDFGRLHPDIRIAYAAEGSGAGVGGLLDKTFDFCGSDAPMDAGELAKAKAAGCEVVQVPSVAGAVVLAYNIPGFNGELKFSGPVIADIYLGKITRWNDPSIKALNPEVALPDTQITPVHRSDGSGTNFVFTNYLCTQSEEFQTQVNFGKTVRWPDGQGGAQNFGVAQAIQKTAGAIGYIELDYAVKNHIPFGRLQNRSGKFIKAWPETVSAAGEAALKDMDRRHTLAVRLWDRRGDAAYPIASFTYLICYKDLSYLKDKAKAQAIVDFFYYCTHEGQSKAAGMTYAPLSAGIQQRVADALKTVEFDGQPLALTGK